MPDRKPGDVSTVPAYGQHFLMDQNVLRRQLKYVSLSRDDIVLEIGTGTGQLTKLLVQQAQQVISIEIDRQFQRGLQSMEQRCHNLKILWGDAMKLEWPVFNKVAANLPYKIALPLIFRILRCNFQVAVLMVQKRLARRLSASPGETSYGRVTVVVQRLANFRVLEVVKPHAFEPQPQVDSAMLFIKKIHPPFLVNSEEYFKNLLDHLFLRRTKSLSSALMALPGGRRILECLRRDAPAILGKLVMQLTVEEFGKLLVAAENNSIKLDRVPDALKRKAQKYF